MPAPAPVGPVHYPSLPAVPSPSIAPLGNQESMSKSRRAVLSQLPPAVDMNLDELADADIDDAATEIDQVEERIEEAKEELDTQLQHHQ